MPNLASDLITSPNGHADYVLSVAEGAETERPDIAQSWRRCANSFGVDPTGERQPRILTLPEIRGLRGPLDPLIRVAQIEIDRLYELVRPAGYTLLFCDAAGVAIEHRGEEADAERHKYWGVWLGGVWTEAVEGTNGIGTCIAEKRPITVHRSAHYRSRHINLSCSGAPILADDGTLLAVLDVSSCDPELSECAHALTGSLTQASARAIEERYFRARHRRAAIVALAPGDESRLSALLAVDADQRVLGANFAARKAFRIDEQNLRDGVDLWRIFERNPAPFRGRDDTDVPARFVSPCGTTWSGLVTPAESAVAAPLASAGIGHIRPRADFLSALRKFEADPAALSRGGLPPAAMRRVGEHIEANLGEPIDLAALATIAGVSLYHFARAFKRSTGVTPHSYIVRKRIERAQQMLARGERPLAEIAQAVGFADQSHLARHFKQLLGVTPRNFRQSLH